MDLNETAVFVKVVQAGSFSAAARQMDLPNSTVSTRVARLEKRLGVTLLQRTTRRLHLTEAGEMFYRHAAVGLDHMLEAEAAVAAVSGEARGLLRLTAPSDFGDEILVGLIDALLAEHPAIHLELTLTDRFVDLVAEGVDVAIRAGELEDSTLVARRVGVACWAAVASPGYLHAAPSLARPQDLQEHRCLQFTSLGREQWTLAGAGGEVSVPMSGELVVNDMGVIRKEALAGRGIALLPTYVCRREIEDGRLVRVLPEWRAKADPVHLVYPRQRFVPPKLRAFMDVAAPLLQEWLRE
jgi:DNA-binding transcriptional LysR family regulator